MNTILKTAGVVAGAVLALGVAAPAGAAPGDHGKGVGGCIDQLYGNATNARPSGHGVLPSQSPGPWLNNAADPDDPTWGPSMGSLIRAYGFNAGQLRGGSCPF
jgi:hypothetical protein